MNTHGGRGHRRIVAISSAAEKPFQLVQALLGSGKAAGGVEAPLYLGAETGPWRRSVAAACLGTSRDALVVHLDSNPAANEVAALSGCVRGGGIIVLVCEKPQVLTPFWSRFLKLSEALTGKYPLATEADIARFGGVIKPVPAAASEFSATFDQSRAIAAIERCAEGRARRPVVLRSDRGRGKSAAMGIAAANLLARGVGDIVVTAASRQSLDALVAHASEAGGSLPVFRGGHSLYFVPPDELLRRPCEPRLLMIDEAAALPTALLEKLVDLYPRTVLSSTVQGYEGSGRGFELRFEQQLRHAYPQSRFVWLTQPVRWDEKDPVEKLFNQLLALTVEKAAADRPPVTDAALTFTHYNGLDLIANEALLQQAWRLLVEAHHQTSPDDLQQLLDDPTVSLCCGSSDDELICVAMLRREGVLETSIAAAIAGGLRRLPGQRLPQGLAWYCQRPDLAELGALRIVRIAVAGHRRRQAAGSAMLAEVERFVAADNGLDYCGASFAADSAVTAFWMNADYLPLRLGVRRDTGSGLHSLLVVKAPAGPLRAEFAGLRQRFAADFSIELGESFRELDASLALLLLGDGAPSSAADQDIAAAYADGRGSYELVAAALWRWCCRTLPAARCAGAPAELLCSKVLQHQDWGQVVANYGFSGRKAAESALRLAVAEVLEAASTML